MTHPHAPPARKAPAAPLPRERHPGSMTFDERAFVLLVTYVVPVGRIDELLESHRQWLDEHIAGGRFLVSGPQVPRTGGVILARGTTSAQLENVVSRDPLVLAGAATYTVIEFVPSRGPLSWLP